MNKIVLSIAGAFTVLASAVTLIDYTQKRTCKQIIEPPTGELVFALVTAAAGTLLAVMADHTSANKKSPTLGDMLSVEDSVLMSATPTDPESDNDI